MSIVIVNIDFNEMTKREWEERNNKTLHESVDDCGYPFYYYIETK
jgi:hypothetical protein